MIMPLQGILHGAMTRVTCIGCHVTANIFRLWLKVVASIKDKYIFALNIKTTPKFTGPYQPEMFVCSARARQAFEIFRKIIT